MKGIRPDIYKKNIFEIDYEKLYLSGIRCLIFDLDNTLGLIKDETCPIKTKKLIKELKKKFIIVISSNNIKGRINKYINDLEIDGMSFSLKPSIVSLKRIKEKYKLKKKEMIMIGDQILTDVFAAKRFRIKCVLVDPLGEKDLKITSINRVIENLIIKRLERQGKFMKGNYYE